MNNQIDTEIKKGFIYIFFGLVLVILVGIVLIVSFYFIKKGVKQENVVQLPSPSPFTDNNQDFNLSDVNSLYFYDDRGKQIVRIEWYSGSYYASDIYADRISIGNNRAGLLPVGEPLKILGKVVKGENNKGQLNITAYEQVAMKLGEPFDLGEVKINALRRYSSGYHAAPITKSWKEDSYQYITGRDMLSNEDNKDIRCPLNNNFWSKINQYFEYDKRFLLQNNSPNPNLQLSAENTFELSFNNGEKVIFGLNVMLQRYVFASVNNSRCLGDFCNNYYFLNGKNLMIFDQNGTNTLGHLLEGIDSIWDKTCPEEWQTKI